MFVSILFDICFDRPEITHHCRNSRSRGDRGGQQLRVGKGFADKKHLIGGAPVNVKIHLPSFQSIGMLDAYVFLDFANQLINLTDENGY